jgi:hypothetical protein
VAEGEELGSNLLRVARSAISYRSDHRGVRSGLSKSAVAELFRPVAVGFRAATEERQMRDDNLDRRAGGLSGGVIAAIAAVCVFALLFMWAPWSGPKVADNSAPGTTVGSSTRPAAPVAPAPSAPAAPATTR